MGCVSQKSSDSQITIEDKQKLMEDLKGNDLDGPLFEEYLPKLSKAIDDFEKITQLEEYLHGRKDDDFFSE